MTQAPKKLLTDLLKDVSRSFYLTLRVLPKSIRPQIGLAYLLARTTDTVADTELVSVDQRLRVLKQLRDRIQGTEDVPVNFGELMQRQGSPAERRLLEQCEASLTLLKTLAGPDRQLVREVLGTITSGQELDLRRFAEVSPPPELKPRLVGNKMENLPPRIVALHTDLELDDYTYRVAGCVGEFWTKMCLAHVFTKDRLDNFSLLMNGKRFGIGLQLVNILRDLPADLRAGRCYLPSERLATVKLTPEDLLKPASEPKLRPLYNKYLERAAGHLNAGWVYTNALPRHSMRVRLACAWPILIGVHTLHRLRTENVLDPQQRIKISRQDVRKIIWQTVIYYPWPSVWKPAKKFFAQARARVLKILLLRSHRTV